jgi:L-ascorbate metabolism protein UlaG (beta-lactamase superfamily)
MRYLLFLLLSAGLSCSSTKDSVEKPYHHTENGFQNNHTIDKHGFGDFLRWQWDTIGKNQTRVEYQLDGNDPDFILNNRTEPTVTWVGHATFLIQFDGLNILTDPIFSERCSPFQWAGPKRTTPPGIDFENLPEIDIVLISHDHFDHLDEGTVVRMREKQPDNPPAYYVPLGIKAWFNDLEVENVTEYDWWDNEKHDNVLIHCVPAQHFSGRSLFNRNGTLWSGWVLQFESGYTMYFAGDTGYSPDFKNIGDRFGPMDLSFIPIGAYKPRWFMGPVHVDPAQAVKIHEDVQSKKTIAMHWGVFGLADEDMDEPPKLLKEARDSVGIEENEFFVMRHGQMINLNEEIEIKDPLADSVRVE